MRFYSFRSACLLSAVCLVTLTWIKRTPGDEASAGSSVSPEMENLYNRLLAAEGLGRQVSRDLSSILWQLGNVSTNVTLTNTTNATYGLSLERHQTGDGGGSMFPLPNIYSYMPHLRQHPDSLVPNIAVGQGRRGVSLVLGIPTVKRAKQSYLVNTLSSLLYSLTLSQSQDLIIIIFVAETDTDYVNSVAETIRKNFPREVHAGLLEVVSPSQYYYPDFNSIQETFGDSKDRVKWRTKQNLDFSFLMLYSQDKGTYYVQLEDDIVAREGYYNNMKAFAVQEASKSWLYLEFSQLGFIGKMFRTRDLSMIAEFFLMFHRDKPIDWLLDHILWVKVCNPEKDTKHCNEQKASLKRMYKPSLFQHVGLHSSLPGKLQHLKDKDFGKQTLYRAHNNPVAELSSSLKHYQEHSLERAYKGEDFFWALTPIQGDYILLKFPEPIHISRYLFRSGNIETSLDKFYNTTVEVLPSSTLTQDKLVTGWSTSHHRELDKYFITIGEFENGEAKGELKQELQPVAALRLVVHSDSDVWAVLSEIHIEV